MGSSRRYHDRVARQYDAIYDDPYWRFHDELTWRSIKPHLPGLRPAAALDLGCGTGKWGLKLLKAGFDTTFVDHSGAMIEQARAKAAATGPHAKRATLLVADMIDLAALAPESFHLILAMGDPLSICTDAARAVGQMRHVCRPGGIVIASADNKLAAIDHFVQHSTLDELEDFVRTGRTEWLTADARERFPLTMFTPDGLTRLFERGGFEVVDLIGKTILPLRRGARLLENPDAVERLLRLESELAKDRSAGARASHLQITARRR